MARPRYSLYSSSGHIFMWCSKYVALRKHFPDRMSGSLSVLQNAQTRDKKVLKLIFSEEATNFCEISSLDLSYVVTVESTMDILQNFVAF